MSLGSLMFAMAAAKRPIGEVVRQTAKTNIGRNIQMCSLVGFDRQTDTTTYLCSCALVSVATEHE